MPVSKLTPTLLFELGYTKLNPKICREDLDITYKTRPNGQRVACVAIWFTTPIGKGVEYMELPITEAGLIAAAA